MLSEKAAIDPLARIRDLAQQSQRASQTIDSLVTGMMGLDARNEGNIAMAGSTNFVMSLDFLMNFAEAAPLLAIEIIPGIEDPLIIKATRTFEKMFEYRPGELTGKPLTVVATVAKRPDHRKWMLEFVMPQIVRNEKDVASLAD